MLKNCPHCGAANRERAHDCYVCEAPLPEYSPAEPEPLEEVYPDVRAADGKARDVAGDLARDILENIPDPATAPAPAAPTARPSTVTEFRPSASKASVALADEPALVSEPEWKREVASKLEEYRSRRQRSGEDSQSALPFNEQAEATPEAAPNPLTLTDAKRTEGRESLRFAARSRPQTAEPVAIAAQPELDFESLLQQSAQQLTNRLVPVAPLRHRVHAGLLDAGFLVISYGGFLLMFASLGNPLTFGRVEVAVYAAALFLIYGLYITLFTGFGSATPGMLLRNLHAVSFDGNPPSQQQMLWRSFGYLVSAAAGLLGFLWALWDEDHLTWHDRISQTYLTQSHPAPHSAGLSSSSGSTQSYKLF
jgi:uncharacterized RDD family membrane protein YckC